MMKSQPKIILKIKAAMFIVISDKSCFVLKILSDGSGTGISF